jgi:hypothetical protein
VDLPPYLIEEVATNSQGAVIRNRKMSFQVNLNGIHFDPNNYDDPCFLGGAWYNNPYYYWFYDMQGGIVGIKEVVGLPIQNICMRT